MATGLINTLLITFFAVLIGVGLGGVIALTGACYEKNGTFCFLNFLFRMYLAVIRGTPVVLQLFICYFVLLTGIRNTNFLGIKDTAGVWVAIVTFGINSGAYMAEILRGGINAVDQGQMEAGRSLGLSWISTFVRIILPQALKSAIPTMFNEFITLIKETSVAGYVGIVDLTKIQSYVTVQTMELFTPLVIIAVIYLVIVLGLQKVQNIIERRLKKSER